jgi:hypothetical protein
MRNGLGRERVEAVKGATVDLARQRFPTCIVWTPLPPLTWILPFIGHMGIADTRGGWSTDEYASPGC